MHDLNPVYIFADGSRSISEFRYRYADIGGGRWLESAPSAVTTVRGGWVLMRRVAIANGGSWERRIPTVFPTRDAALAAAELLR